MSDKTSRAGLALGTNPAPTSEPTREPSREITDRDLVIGLTINYPPTRNLTARQQKRLRMRDWGILTPRQQIDILKEDLENKVYPHIDMAETHFEFTKSGQIHSHSILIMKNEKKHALYNLMTFRKQLSQEFKVTGKSAIRMCHCFEVDDIPKWIEYVRKSDEDMPCKIDYHNINMFLKYK